MHAREYYFTTGETLLLVSLRKIPCGNVCVHNVTAQSII